MKLLKAVLGESEANKLLDKANDWFRKEDSTILFQHQVLTHIEDNYLPEISQFRFSQHPLIKDRFNRLATPANICSVMVQEVMQELGILVR